jgi:hypothetical protein
LVRALFDAKVQHIKENVKEFELDSQYKADFLAMQQVLKKAPS